MKKIIKKIVKFADTLKLDVIQDITVSSSAGTLSEELALVSKKSGEYKPVTVYTDPLTGKRVAPDVGWSHNPASGLIEGN